MNGMNCGLAFFFLLIHLFIPQGEAVCLCLCMHMWRSRDNLLKSGFFFSFQPVGPRGPTQVGHQASCVSGITPLFAEVLWEEEGTGLL